MGPMYLKEVEEKEEDELVFRWAAVRRIRLGVVAGMFGRVRTGRARHESLSRDQTPVYGAENLTWVDEPEVVRSCDNPGSVGKRGGTMGQGEGGRTGSGIK